MIIYLFAKEQRKQNMVSIGKENHNDIKVLMGQRLLNTG